MNRITGVLLLDFLMCGAFAFAGERTESSGRTQPRLLTVQEAIQLTLARAPEVALASAQAARAEQALREARSLNLPQLVTGTGLAYNNGFPLSIEGAAPSIFQVGLSQSIFSKKNKNLILEAEESSKGSKLGPESARNSLAAKTALVYYELFQSARLMGLWTDRLQAAAKEQQITESLQQAGKARPLDVTLAQTATAAARQQVLAAEEQAKMAETALRDLTGIPEGTPIDTTEPSIDDQILSQPAENLYRKALETSPQILQAEADVRAKEFHVEAEKGEGRPRLDIVSQYALFSKTNNYQDFFNKFTRNNFLIGLSVQVPLLDGHRASARVAQSEQEAAEARFRMQRAKSDLRLNIERAQSALRVARGAAELSEREVSAAHEALQVNETLLQAGRISPKELELSRSQLREKEIARLESEKTLFERKIELLQVTGTVASLY